MVKKIREPIFEESEDCPAELQEPFRKHIEAFEEAEWGQPFQILEASGISLPAPETLADEALSAKLWEVIHALALIGDYLEHTDHLSDRELYTELWEDVLREETIVQSPPFDLVCHVDLIGSGSEEDCRIFLKYYADDRERSLWFEDFSGERLPDKASLPFDRDRRLPKPQRDVAQGVH